MSTNSVSPKQDYSSWGIKRLGEYMSSLNTVKDRRDRHTRKKIEAILAQKLQEPGIYLKTWNGELILPSRLRASTQEELSKKLNSEPRYVDYELPFQCTNEAGKVVYMRVKSIRETKEDYIPKYRESESLQDILGFTSDNSSEKIWELLSGGYPSFEECLPIIQYKIEEYTLQKPEKYYIFPVRI